MNNETIFYTDVTLPEASASAYSAISAHIMNLKFLLSSDSKPRWTFTSCSTKYAVMNSETIFYTDVTLAEASASAYSAISAHIMNLKFLLSSDSKPRWTFTSCSTKYAVMNSETIFYTDVTLAEASASAYSAISAHIMNLKFLLGSNSKI